MAAAMVYRPGASVRACALYDDPHDPLGGEDLAITAEWILTDLGVRLRAAAGPEPGQEPAQLAERIAARRDPARTPHRIAG